MLEVLPSLIILALAFCGWGNLILKAIGYPNSGLSEFGWSGFAGLFVTAVVGSALSFFQPLKVIAFPFALAGILLFGIALFVHRDRLRGFPWAILLGLFLLCAALAAREQIHGDTGLYHLQAVQWIAEEPAVAGLANLHGRFGFNSAWWVITAMMQLPWLAPGQAAYFPVSILGVFFGTLLIDAALSMWKRQPLAEQIVIVCSFYLWFRQLAGGNNPSVATDPPANLLGVATAACMVRAFVRRDSAAASLSLILATLAVATKLSAAVWLPATAVGMLWICLSSAGSRGKFRSAATAVAFSIMLGVLWCARGIYCSGFPFYPSQCFGLPGLPWTVSTSNAIKDFADVQNWPTRGVSSTSLTEMFKRWIENQYGFTNIVFVAGLLAIGIGAIALLIKVARNQGWSVTGRKMAPLLFPLATTGAGLIFCFSIAPAMRFASGYFFASFGILLAIISSVHGRFSSSIRTMILVCLAASAVALNAAGVWHRNVNWLSIPSFPVPQVEELRTDRGVTIRVNAPNGLAWNALRPSTPYFHPDIIFDLDKNGNTTVVRLPQ